MADLSQIKVGSTTYDIKDTNGRKEEYLEWGGRNIAGNISPIGMAISVEHSANRLAFINGAALTFEYSSNGGSSWTDYGFSASQKSAFCTTTLNVPIGRLSGSTEYTTSSQTRITLTCQTGSAAYVYTDPRKLLINMSTSPTTQVVVEYRTGTNYQNNGAWSTFGTYNVSGWSGWNDIPLVLGTLGGGSTQTGNNWQLRLTFKITAMSSNKTNANVIGIRLFGTNNWTQASTMSGTGHLYSYDISQNATFPAQVTATQFNGKINGYTISASVPSGALFTDHTYNFSGTAFTSNNSTGTNANDITYNAHTYYTSNGPATSLGATTNDGALYTQAYSTSWVAQIAQDYRNGGLFVRGKNNGTWQSWAKVYDTNHKPTWDEVTSKPSSFTPSSHGHGVNTANAYNSISSTAACATALNTTSINSTSGSNVIAVNASVSGDNLTLSSVTASKVTTTPVTVATGIKTTANAITGLGTGAFATSVKNSG